MSLRICIASEAIKRPFDEGVKIFVYNLIKEFSRNHDVLGLSRTDDFEGEIDKFCEKVLPANILFISSSLREKIRTFQPDIIYYLPTACATFYSFLRTRILKLYGKGARTIMITLQPREYSAIQRLIIPFIAPDLVLAQSAKTLKVLMHLGCKVKLISAGVDLQRFAPVSKEAKEGLRKKYDFPADKYIILHVGHINRNRNVQFLKDIQNMDDIQALVVGSTSYPEDRDLVKELESKGVIVITSFIENIEEIYQCADCYLFPVFSEGACIEIPLSIFEAMACNLSVVTSKFGGLYDLIQERGGFIYVNGAEEIKTKIKEVKKIVDPETRHLIKKYNWESVTKDILLNSEV